MKCIKCNDEIPDDECIDDPKYEDYCRSCASSLDEELYWEHIYSKIDERRIGG